MRVLSYDFVSCLEGARCHHAGWALRRLSREHSTEQAGVRGAPPSASSRSWETQGTAVHCSNRRFSFFFFCFSPMETVNHISALPVVYISHDSYQGGLPLLAQTHQPSEDTGQLFCARASPCEPRIRCFHSVGFFHLQLAEEGVPQSEGGGSESKARMSCSEVRRCPFLEKSHSEVLSSCLLLMPSLLK